MKMKTRLDSNNGHQEITMMRTIERASASARALDGELQDLLTKMVAIDRDICKLEDRRMLIEEQIGDVRKAYNTALDKSLQYRKWVRTIYKNKKRLKQELA